MSAPLHKEIIIRLTDKWPHIELSVIADDKVSTDRKFYDVVASGHFESTILTIVRRKVHEIIFHHKNTKET